MASVNAINHIQLPVLQISFTYTPILSIQQGSITQKSVL